MKQLVLLVVMALLVPLMVYAMLIGPLAPFWLLVPALVFAALYGAFAFGLAFRLVPFVMMAFVRIVFFHSAGYRSRSGALSIAIRTLIVSHLHG